MRVAAELGRPSIGGTSICSTNDAVQALGSFDVILCRNVLIYFRDQVVSRVVGFMRERLRADGALFVGVSESLMRFGNALECEERAGVFLYRKPRALTVPIRVLIVDDSAFVRKVLRELLSQSPEIEVVGIARDGLDALEKVDELKPDVLTLDLMMPNLDGLGVLEALPLEGAPRVIVVSISGTDTELGAAALQAGALDIVRKPTALATDQLYELGDELIRKVKQAAVARPQRFTQAIQTLPVTSLSHTREVIVLGTSTGGPQAITRLLAVLPGSLPVPIVIALHIPAGYTEALAARLDAGSALDVREAEDGMELRPGLAVLARGGAHVRSRSSRHTQLYSGRRASGQCCACPVGRRVVRVGSRHLWQRERSASCSRAWGTTACWAPARFTEPTAKC